MTMVTNGPNAERTPTVSLETSNNYQFYDSFKVRRLVGRIAQLSDENKSLGLVASRNHHLTLKSIKGLIDRTEWLNDDVINTYLMVLNNQYGSAVSLLDSYWSYCLTARGQDAVNHQVKTQEVIAALSTLRLILVPVHLNENHWVLCSIFPLQREWSIYDSTGNKASVLASPFYSEMKKWLEAATNHPMEFTFPISQEQLHQDTSSDYSSCGVWVCYYAEQLCMGRTATEIAQNKASNIVIYRNVILVTLVREVPLELEY